MNSRQVNILNVTNRKANLIHMTDSKYFYLSLIETSCNFIFTFVETKIQKIIPNLHLPQLKLMAKIKTKTVSFSILMCQHS